MVRGDPDMALGRASRLTLVRASTTCAWLERRGEARAREVRVGGRPRERVEGGDRHEDTIGWKRRCGGSTTEERVCVEVSSLAQVLIGVRRRAEASRQR